MSDRITTIIDDLPEELRPLAAAIIDSAADGLLDNLDGLLDALLTQDANAALSVAIQDMPTQTMVTLMQQVNARISNEADIYAEKKAQSEEFFRQLFLIALTLLKQEVVEQL